MIQLIGLLCQKHGIMVYMPVLLTLRETSDAYTPIVERPSLALLYKALILPDHLGFFGLKKSWPELQSRC